MSERLLIKFSDTPYDNIGSYDGVYTEEGTIKDLLDWIGYSNGRWWGPLKIIVADPELIPFFEVDFVDLKNLAPIGIEDVSSLSWKDHCLDHPTRKEFHKLFTEYYHEDSIASVHEKKIEKKLKELEGAVNA